MGRKKVGIVNQAQEAVELKPFCYYCDREFDTVKTLITHQRTKHFNCAECGLKFDTVTGLRVHMLNAYKKTMKEVPNAMAGRENPDIVVHGMEGLPKGLVEERTRKALADKAEKDKVREEESRERLKQLSAARAAEARADGDDQAPPPPEAKRPTPSPPAPSIPPSIPPPAAPSAAASAQEPQRLQQQPHLLYLQQQQQPRQAAPDPPPPASGAMPGLSPSVAQLLTGGSDDVPYLSPIVPGLVAHGVPPALHGLHPVALQVLASANALPAKPAVAPTGPVPPGVLPAAFSLPLPPVGGLPPGVGALPMAPAVM